MYTRSGKVKRALDNCSNQTLVDTLEAYCYAYIHNPTESNARSIDRLKNEILRRLEANNASFQV